MNINHLLIRTDNLQAMTLFFTQVIGLRKGHRPPFPFPGVWIYNQDKPIIHLVKEQDNPRQNAYLGTEQKSTGGGLVDHIAFEGERYSELIERTEKHGFQYFERTVPLSQEHQVFIAGPNNIKVEIVFDENKESLNTLIKDTSDA